MVSHGPGQGYTDLHFLIPELTVSVDGYKGPYYARFGDFATAGAVEIKLAEMLPESYAQYSHGEYGIQRGLVIASPRLPERYRTVLAAEIAREDGPFQVEEDLRKYNAFARASYDMDTLSKVTLTLMSYGSEWNGSGQIPARAVCGEGELNVPLPGAYAEPCIDRFGSVDPHEGGNSQRHLVSVAYATQRADAEFSSMVYAVKYGFQLYSNFTFFAEDPVNGDQIEQTDDRTVVGSNVNWHHHHSLGPVRMTTTVGAQFRADAIENALYRDVARRRLITVNEGEVNERALALYAQEEIRPTRALQFTLGARGDHVDVGSKSAARFSPKFMAVISPIDFIDLFADYGWGFHSNDARGANQTTSPATLLTPAVGYEVGTRLKPLEGFQVSVAAFLLDLDSELVWSGDAGATEASDASRRYGIEIEGRYHLSNWFFADASATFTRARYRANAGNGDAVALAPTQTFSAGAGFQRAFGSYTPFAALRAKVVAERPATEDESLYARGFGILDGEAGLRWRNVEARVDVQNILNAQWREVSFANESRLAYEPAPVGGIHYTPGWPRTVMGSVRLYWQ
jgi:outer membrane receptor protein involved in Fe transport